MKTFTHDHYQFSQDDNILTVTAQGHFNEETIQQYLNDMQMLIDEIKHNPWATLTIFKGSSIFTPEAEQALIHITQERIRNNMNAIAIVLQQSSQADLQQMQLTRVYQQCKIQYNFFSDTKTAKTWLSSVVNLTN